MENLGLPGLIAVFAAAGAVTWVAGLSLSKATNILDERFDLGDAVGGMLLLGLAGSLPELAVTISAALSGHLALATGNLLGGVAIQTLVIVFLDFRFRDLKPITSLASDTAPLLESMMVIVVMIFALLGGVLPASVALGPVSPASIAVVLFFVLGMVALNRARRRVVWTAKPVDTAKPTATEEKSTSTTRNVVLWFTGASVLTLIAGVLLEQSSNALATDLGLSGVVFGATILASVTALPEISSGLQAVRLGTVDLAMSDIYGGNAMQLTFFLLADILAGEPVLPTASAESLWLGGLGIALTGILAFGLLVRPENKRFRMGPDSWLALATYCVGVLFLLVIPD